jgi:drug/metabolite transporter (DMT)-like permease
MLEILFAFLSPFLSVIRESFFRYSGINIFILTALNSIGMLLFSSFVTYVKFKNNFFEKIKKALSHKDIDSNILLSSISLIRYLLLFFAVSILPLNVSIPFLTLSIFFVIFFDSYLRDGNIRTIEYIGAILSFIGAIIINLHKIFGKKGLTTEVKEKHYFFGIVLLFLSMIANGYVFTKLKDIAVDYSAEEAYLNESVFSGLVMIVLLFIYLFFSKIKIPKKQWIYSFFFFLIIGGLTVYTRVLSLKYLPEITANVIFNTRTIISLFVASYFFNEVIHWNGYVGAFIILFSVLIILQF